MKTTANNEMAQDRWAALKSWLQAGYNIGWDLGQGLTLFLPKGLLQPFKKVAPNKANDSALARDREKLWWQSLSVTDKFYYYSKQSIKNGVLAPAVFSANYVVGPILGMIMGILMMFPGVIGGLIFKQHIRNLKYRYAINIVDQHSGTAVWGALGMGAIFTFTSQGGGFGMPGFSLPSFGLTSVITITPVVANWVVPMAVAYGMMILLSVAQALDRVYDISRLFAFHSGDKQMWVLPLKGKINAKLKNTQIKNRIKALCLAELEQMSQLYTQKSEEYRQQFEKEPYQYELTRQGLLTQYDLVSEQSALIDQLSQAQDKQTKEKILDKRQLSFAQRIQAIK